MLTLLEKIAACGRQNPSLPCLSDVELFKPYFAFSVDRKPHLTTEDLDNRDGNCTRRELLARFLLLNAVLDQGPDTEGVRIFLSEIVNRLYRKEFRILHTPSHFFAELGIEIDDDT